MMEDASLESAMKLSFFRANYCTRALADAIKEARGTQKDVKKKKTSEPRPLRPYRKHSTEEKNFFLAECIDRPNQTISGIARELGLNQSTARCWFIEYKRKSAGNNQFIPSKGRSRSCLGDAHAEILHQKVLEDAALRLTDLHEHLSEAFEDLLVSASTFYNFFTKQCHITCKNARHESIERNSPAKLQQRFNFVQQILESGINYLKECIFLDEAGFNKNMKRSQGWAPKGKTPVILTPSTKSENISVLGAICYLGVVSLSIRVPGKARKRKRDEHGKIVQTPRGTNAPLFIQFLSHTLDNLDEFPQFKNCYLVMDNASFHRNRDVRKLIELRGYKCLYLPPYSPELNPIEQFWYILKSKIKKVDLAAEKFPDLLQKATLAIPEEDFTNIIQHSINQFQRCRDKDPL